MAQKKISLKDLATELNTSVSTVSRALKNHPDIGHDLKLKAFELAKKYNYPVAQNKKVPQISDTHTIGVIVPNIERNFYASIISGIEAYAKEKGYFIIIANSRENYIKEVECIDNLIKLNVDGLIVCLSQETTKTDHFLKARKNNIPLVFFDRVCLTKEYSSVIADNTEAGYAITKHLIDAGSKFIAHIAGPKPLSITKERIAGYFKALEEAKIPYRDEHLAYSDLTPESTIKAVQKLLNTQPTPDAIFCVNDTVAYIALKEIKKAGYQVPNDIAVTGFNDEFHSSIVEPELTTISHPTFEMGEETARLLLSQLASDYPHSPRQVIMKTRLVVRQSSLKSYQTNQL